MTNESKAMELVYVDPKSLIIDTNVRTIVDIDPLFSESIRDAGVRQPPTCWRDEDGNIHVECGQRRTLAAVQTGLTQIPVLIVSRETAVEERMAERDRIVSQLAENDQRAALTDSERVVAFQQLALFGMTADEIAKSTKTKRDRVRAAVKLSKDRPDTVELMQERQLTIDDALVLQEFQDHPDMLNQLEAALREDPLSVPRRVEDMRRKLAYLAEEEGFIAIAAEAGVTEWRTNADITEWNGDHRPLADVRIGSATEAPTLEEALAQGGVVATMHTSYEWTDGARTSSSKVKYYIEQASSHGYKVPRAGSADTLTEAEREQRKKERADLKARKARWGDATDFRHGWIREQLRSNHEIWTPLQSAAFIAKALIGHRDVPYANLSSVSRDKQIELTLNFLEDQTEFEGTDWMLPSLRIAHLGTVAEANQVSAAKVSLAFAFAGIESIVANPKNESYGRDRTLAPYLQQLNAWGYPLAEIEQELVDEHIAKEEERAARNLERAALAADAAAEEV